MASEIDNLETWRIFLEYVRTGSVRETARLLKVDPSVISRRIDALESALGLQLTVRSGRSRLLTETGANAARRFAPILRSAGIAQAALRKGAPAVERTLHIVAPIGYTHEIVRRAAVRFAARYRSVRFWLESWPYGAERFQDLGAGIDLIITTIRRANPAFHIEELSKHRTICTASPSFLRQFPLLKRPGDLMDLPLAGNVQFITGQVFRHRKTGEEVAIDPSFQILSDNSQALAEIAATGDALLLGCPYTVAAPFIREGRLVEALPDWRLPDNHVFAYSAEAEWSNPDSLVSSFVRCLKETSDLCAALADAVFEMPRNES